MAGAKRARTAAGRETAPPVELVLRWIAVPAELTTNIDNPNVANSMTCFRDGGQLHDYVDAFNASLNGA